MKKFVHLSILIFMGGVNALFSAETSSEVDLGKGRKVFESTCFVCHGSDGKGPLPGVPDLTKKDSRLLQEVELLVKHAIEGYQTPGNPLAMPPKGGNPGLSESEIRDSVAYMRAQFAPNPKKK